MPCATRRPAWGWASTSPTCARMWTTTTPAPPRASGPCTSRGSRGGWCSPRRWSSTARVATAATSMVTSAQPLDPLRTSPPVASIRPASSAGSPCGGRPSRRRRRRIPATRMPPPSCTRSTCSRSTAASTTHRSRRCDTTTCTGRGARWTRRTRAWRRSSGQPWPGASRRGCSRTAARRETSCTSRDVARANVLALTAPRPYVGALNIASGTPRTVLELANEICAGTGLQPAVIGGGRLGDVRHVVASPTLAHQQLGFRAQEPFSV